VDPETYTLIKHNIKKFFNINLEYYKSQQMHRRLDSWLNRVGAPNWSHYFQRLRMDEEELARFRDYLTINVSSFFRDPERWETLRAEVIPYLLQNRPPRGSLYGGLKVWSAGCSIGVEPYSLAMLLEETAPHRYAIIASDVDRGALAKAKNRGPFTSDDTKNLSAAQRQAYLEPGGPPFFVKKSVAQKIDFREHNLFADPYPENLDLIVCRNVVIYFTGEAKTQLYRAFHQALRPGGILFVGATEIIPRSKELGFHSFSISFYRKA